MKQMSLITTVLSLATGLFSASPTAVGQCCETQIGCGSSPCQSYLSPCCGCGVGGVGGFALNGWGAMAPIDVDTLTPSAQSKSLYESSQARLVFTLPEDADVTLSGRRMSTAGDSRSFLIPVNDQKLTYKYDIRIDVVRGGQTYYKKQTIETLRAGAILNVMVEAPPVPDGEPAQIAIAVEPVMPGGPTEDEDSEEGDGNADNATDAFTAN